jgi:hypothetical protein
MPTYHDLYITTERIQRTSIFNLPFDLMVICHRTSGWELRDMAADKCLAGEYDTNWLILDVAGTVIVNSRKDLIGEDGPLAWKCSSALTLDTQTFTMERKHDSTH